MSYSECLRNYGLTIELEGASLIVSPAELVTADVAELIREHKQTIVAEISNARLWSGNAAALVEWYRDNRDRLPSKPFTLEYWPDGTAMVIWATPQASYARLDMAIEDGPDGPEAASLLAVLVKLQARCKR